MIRRTAVVLFLFAAVFLKNGLLNAEPSCSTDNYLNDCGHLGIQQEECEAKGCCWNPSVSSGSPWCFYTNDGYTECSLTAERRNCGDSEIEEPECTARGCCWDEDEIDGELPCFYPNSANSPDECPSDVDRVECGYVGITRDICETMGCCWSPKWDGSNEPWCFEKPPAVDMVNPDFDTCCPHSRRHDCGFSGISENECLERGCCFDPTERSGSGPWCYSKNCKDPSLETCAADDFRIECGNRRLGEQGCKDRGCCYSPKDNSPWCFFKNSGPREYASCCPAYDRVECGFYGITEGQCNERGCCWSPLEESSDEPWCFRQNCDNPSLDFCSPEDERVDCGYYGIKQGQCEDRGCCWSPIEKGPYCFFKNYRAGACCDASAKRVECGFLGIDQEECESKECCWSPLEEGSEEPWCFYQNSDVCEERETVTIGEETFSPEVETVTTLSTEETEVAATPATSVTKTTEEAALTEESVTTTTTTTEEAASTEESVSTSTEESIFGEVAASIGQTREEYTTAAEKAAGFESTEYELEGEWLGWAYASVIEIEVEYRLIPQPQPEEGPMALKLGELRESRLNAETEDEEIKCSLCAKEKKEGYTKSSTEVTNTTVEEIVSATLGPDWIRTSKPIHTEKTKEGSEAPSEGEDATSDELESDEDSGTESKTLSSSASFKEETHTPGGTTESTKTQSETTQDIKERGKGAETEIKTRMKTKTETHSASFEDIEGEMYGCTTIISKIKCAEKEVGEKACLDMGCCWQEDPTGLFPSCYKKGSI